MIEVMVVVVGIFIGLQVDDWRTAHENKRFENQYITHLHDELSLMIIRDKTVVKRSNKAIKLLEEAGLYFSQSSDTLAMTPEHCFAIARSHIFADAIESPAVIKELLVTGRIMLISKDALRASIVNFDSSIEAYKQLRDDIQQDRIVLSRRHSELISMGFGWDKTECNFERMAKHRGFLNEFYDNMLRYLTYSRVVILEQQIKRVELHKLLDKELNITHSE